jgi:hypothetical protein
MVWGSIELGPSPPNYVPPAGTLAARATVNVKHVSIAELDVDANAVRTETTLIASLLLTISSGELAVSVIQFDVGAVTPHRFTLPLRIGFLAIPTGSYTVAGGALLRQGDIVTFRLATTSDDDLLAPPANRLGESGGWLIRVPGEVFADDVRRQLGAVVTPPPSGTTIEDAPTASWSFSEGRWRAVGNVGLKKPDACPTLFGRVSLSIDVGVALDVIPNPATRLITIRLSIASDVSDWDTFRCWAGSGGVLAALGGAVNPVLGAAAAGVSLVAVGETVRLLAGSEVTSTSVSSMREVARTSTTVTFETEIPLPRFPDDIADPTEASVDGNGLIVRGDFRTLATATHQPSFNPAGGTLPAGWASGYSCSLGRWRDTYVVRPIVVRDRVFIVTKPVMSRFVRVFPTSLAAPDAVWALAPTAPSIDPQITVTAIVGPSPGQTGRVFLHTSAGIRRYDLAPVPVPREPTIPEIAEGRVNCLKPFLPPMVEIDWLPDPPFFDLGLPPLRQWLVAISEVREGARVEVHVVRDRRDVAEPVQIVAPRTAPLSLEIMTDASSTLQIRHTSEMPAAQCRIQQRWVLPVRAVDLPGRALALERRGDTLTVRTTAGAVAWNRVTGATAPSPAVRSVDRTDVAGALDQPGDRAAYGEEQVPPFSVRLRDGLIALAWSDKLVIARPWGEDVPARTAEPTAAAPV